MNLLLKMHFQLIEQDKADIILEIPTNFEKDLVREDHQNFSLLQMRSTVQKQILAQHI
jgi:hypothetical protein